MSSTKNTWSTPIGNLVEYDDLVFFFSTPQKAQGAPARCLRGKSAERTHPASSLKYHGCPWASYGQHQVTTSPFLPQMYRLLIYPCRIYWELPTLPLTSVFQMLITLWPHSCAEFCNAILCQHRDLTENLIWITRDMQCLTDENGDKNSNTYIGLVVQKRRNLFSTENVHWVHQEKGITFWELPNSTAGPPKKQALLLIQQYYLGYFIKITLSSW